LGPTILRRVFWFVRSMKVEPQLRTSPGFRLTGHTLKTD
jgi:hypothetical protein